MLTRHEVKKLLGTLESVNWMMASLRMASALQPGERVLDVACGNGLAARRMAAGGAEVVAIDFSEQMIKQAQSRTIPGLTRIRYSVIDATDYDALLTLGRDSFDAALCNMALFDMAEITPLM